jgi:hypothetical protein
MKTFYFIYPNLADSGASVRKTKKFHSDGLDLRIVPDMLITIGDITNSGFPFLKSHSFDAYTHPVKPAYQLTPLPYSSDHEFCCIWSFGIYCALKQDHFSKLW